MIDTVTSPLLNNIPGISHGFTTRRGGVSQGHFASLNAGLEKEDPEANVLENRRRIAEHLGGNVENLVTLRQVHSNKVAVIHKPWIHRNREEGDALVTAMPGLIIGIITADCVPILIADPTARVVAAIHAGWQGAVSGIISNAVKAMVQLGANPAAMTAAIGPCIWQQSYEVSHDFYENFPFAKTHFVPGKPGHWQFDLPGFVHHLLMAEGVKAISPSAYDTYSHEDRFFSYRRKTHRQEPVFGCSLSAILLT